MILVRLLTEADVVAYRTLRLECLRDHPEAFGSSFEEEQGRSDAEWRARLSDPALPMFGGFVDGAAAGICGLFRETKRKHAHMANFGAMYVRPSARGSGLADALVAAALDYARGSGVEIVLLTVTTGNETAQRLYERHGFRVYGELADAIRTGGRSYGEKLMAARLGRSADGGAAESASS